LTGDATFLQHLLIGWNGLSGLSDVMLLAGVGEMSGARRGQPFKSYSPLSRAAIYSTISRRSGVVYGSLLRDLQR
jgi:hypothetical protein